MHVDYNSFKGVSLWEVGLIFSLQYDISVILSRQGKFTLHTGITMGYSITTSAVTRRLLSHPAQALLCCWRLKLCCFGDPGEGWSRGRSDSNQSATPEQALCGSPWRHTGKSLLASCSAFVGTAFRGIRKERTFAQCSSLDSINFPRMMLIRRVGLIETLIRSMDSRGSWSQVNKTTGFRSLWDIWKKVVTQKILPYHLP